MQMLVTIEQQDKTKPNNGLVAKIVCIFADME
jgi:hypothetical protein